MNDRAVLPFQPTNLAAVLAEHRASEQRVLAESKPIPAPVILEDFVCDVLDGVVGDYQLPFPSQEHARLAVEYQLTARGGRRLMQNERTQVMLAVTFEWNSRVQAAKLAAFQGRAD